MGLLVVKIFSLRFGFSKSLTQNCLAPKSQKMRKRRTKILLYKNFTSVEESN